MQRSLFMQYLRNLSCIFFTDFEANTSEFPENYRYSYLSDFLLNICRGSYSDGFLRDVIVSLL